MTVTIEAVEVAGALLSQSRAAMTAASRPLGFAALITWLLDAGSGAYMLSTWIARGGLRRQRATGDRLGSLIVFTHFGMASTGLLVWAIYLATQWALLGWLAVGLLMVVIGLGISTVTLWTPFPAHRSSETPAAMGVFAEPAADALSLAVTDDELARALTDEVLLAKLVDKALARAPEDNLQAARKPRTHLATLIPAGHGIAAITTMLLAAVTVVSAVR